MNYVKVKDNPDLVRDPNTNAILNMNMHAYNDHLRKRRIEEEHFEVVEKVKKIENDINEIKNLMMTIATTINK